MGGGDINRRYGDKSGRQCRHIYGNSDIFEGFLSGMRQSYEKAIGQHIYYVWK